MRNTLITFLFVASVILTGACSTTQGSEMMPEGNPTDPLWGYNDMCRDPERYVPELCPEQPVRQP